VSPQQEGNLILLKLDFISGVFFREVDVLRTLINRCMEYAVVTEDQEGLSLGLRVLVNITLMVS
jgi:hypothetical protein